MASEHPETQLHAQFYPPYRTRDRLKYLAGTELGAGMFAMDVLPETTAYELQQVEVALEEERMSARSPTARRSGRSWRAARGAGASRRRCDPPARPRLVRLGHGRRSTPRCCWRPTPAWPKCWSQRKKPAC
jgi:hypothetical protein